MNKAYIPRSHLDAKLASEISGLAEISRDIQNDLSAFLTTDIQLAAHPELSRLQDLDRLTQTLENLATLHKNLMDHPEDTPLNSTEIAKNMPLQHLVDSLLGTQHTEPDSDGEIELFSDP